MDSSKTSNEEKDSRVNQVQKAISLPRALMTIVLPLWCILVPVGSLIALLTLPITIFKWLTGSSKTIPIDFQITDSDAQCTLKDTILFVHGWPDSGELFNDQVTHFSQNGYRCIVVTLPNFGKKHGGGWGCDFVMIAAMLADIIERYNGGKKTTIFAHDWGCVYAYILQERRPELVSRMVCLDVGVGLSMQSGMVAFVLAYQLFNVLSFFIGGFAGKFMLKSFLRFSGYKGRDYKELHPSMNYPYYYMMKMVFTNKIITPEPDLSTCPIWYGYGTKKPGHFHSDKWLAKVQAADHCHVEEFICDHWITVHKSSQLNFAVLKWFTETSSKRA